MSTIIFTVKHSYIVWLVGKFYGASSVTISLIGEKAWPLGDHVLGCPARWYSRSVMPYSGVSALALNLLCTICEN